MCKEEKGLIEMVILIFFKPLSLLSAIHNRISAKIRPSFASDRHAWVSYLSSSGQSNIFVRYFEIYASLGMIMDKERQEVCFSGLEMNGLRFGLCKPTKAAR